MNNKQYMKPHSQRVKEARVIVSSDRPRGYTCTTTLSMKEVTLLITNEGRKIEKIWHSDGSTYYTLA